MKNLINFKSDINEFKKGSPKWRLKDQISVIQNIENFVWFKKKNCSIF